MKYIEELRDKHKGEEIWVIGAGISLDKYPINFFKDKICIGVNWVFSVFLDINDKEEKFSSRAFYSVHEHHLPPDWIVGNIPHLLKNCFFLLPPHRRAGMAWWEDYNDDPYYMRWGLKGRQMVRASDQDFREMTKCIADKGDCFYVCRGTTLHWAMAAAAVLGAKKIYLVGAEASGAHMRKHGSLYIRDKGPSRKIIKSGEYRFHPLWREGTKSLADAFAPHGINVVYYYYDKGEQKP